MTSSSDAMAARRPPLSSPLVVGVNPRRVVARSRLALLWRSRHGPGRGRPPPLPQTTSVGCRAASTYRAVNRWHVVESMRIAVDFALM